MTPAIPDSLLNAIKRYHRWCDALTDTVCGKRSPRTARTLMDIREHFALELRELEAEATEIRYDGTSKETESSGE